MRRAVVALLALVAAWAAVLVPASPAHAVATTLTIDASPTSVPFEGQTHITGQLLDAANVPVPGVSVSLWSIPVQVEPIPTLVGSDSTDAQGQLALDVTVTKSTRYYWVFAGSGGHEPSTSEQVLVTVGIVLPPTPTQLTAAANPPAIAPGGSSTISGVLSNQFGNLAGEDVVLEQSPNGTTGWTVVGTSTTDASGALSAVRFPTATTFYRWHFAGDAGNLPSTSPAVSVTVGEPVRAPTAMTIHAAPDTIATGASSLLTTSLFSGGAPVPGKTVVLKSSTDSDVDWDDWTVVTTNTTGGNGKTEHSVSPVVDTFYRWGFAGDATYRASRSPTTRVTINDPVPSSLAIEADRTDLFETESTVVRGILTSDAGPRANRTVVLEESVDNGATWTEAATATTSDFGRVARTVAPSATRSYRWRFAGTGTLLPSTSPSVTVKVSPPADTKITIASDLDRVFAGDDVKVTGIITAADAPLAGADMTLYRRDIGGATWTAVGTDESSSTGKAIVVLPARPRSFELHWKYAGTVAARPSESRLLRVDVFIKVTLGLVVRPAKPGDRLLVRGIVRPRPDHATVTLLRKTTRGARFLAKGKIKPDGTYQIATNVKQPGTFDIYAVVEGNATIHDGESPIRTFTVKPP